MDLKAVLAVLGQCCPGHEGPAAAFSQVHRVLCPCSPRFHCLGNLSAPALRKGDHLVIEETLCASKVFLGVFSRLQTVDFSWSLVHSSFFSASVISLIYLKSISFGYMDSMCFFCLITVYNQGRLQVQLRCCLLPPCVFSLALTA